GGLPVRHHAPSASGGRPPRWIDRPSGRLPKRRRITVSRAKRKKPHSIQFAYVSDHRDAAQSSLTKTRVHNSKICCYRPAELQRGSRILRQLIALLARTACTSRPVKWCRP